MTIQPGEEESVRELLLERAKSENGWTATVTQFSQELGVDTGEVTKPLNILYNQDRAEKITGNSNNFKYRVKP
jgi:Mn-dependent DtxR family transcriptional regulator